MVFSPTQGHLPLTPSTSFRSENPYSLWHRRVSLSRFPDEEPISDALVVFPHVVPCRFISLRTRIAVGGPRCQKRFVIYLSIVTTFYTTVLFLLYMHSESSSCTNSLLLVRKTTFSVSSFCHSPSWESLYNRKQKY